MNLEGFKTSITSLYRALEHEQFDLIIGLCRGGLVPAVFISHRLGIPMMVADVTHELSMGDNIDSHNNILPVIPENVKSILVVDDIVDSGSTIIALYEQLKTDADITVAVLYAKEQAIEHITNHTCTRFKKCIAADMITPEEDVWIDFPWEMMDL